MQYVMVSECQGGTDCSALSPQISHLALFRSELVTFRFSLLDLAAAQLTGDGQPCLSCPAGPRPHINLCYHGIFAAPQTQAIRSGLSNQSFSTILTELNSPVSFLLIIIQFTLLMLFDFVAVDVAVYVNVEASENLDGLDI